MVNDKKQILVSEGIIFKDIKGKDYWFLSKKNNSENWELPKTIVRKGESSVRAIIRIMSEQGGMNLKVLEEAGRSSATVNVNGNPTSQKLLFYLIMFKSGAKEVIGFEEIGWYLYDKAIKKLTLKNEQTMLKQAKEVLKIWRKLRQGKKDQDETPI